jgi:hypothetical protein
LIIELFGLALASTVRPTSLAAVSAVLTHQSRRRLLVAFETIPPPAADFGSVLATRCGRRLGV